METKIQNLSMASQALYQSLFIIYKQFKPYFKLTGLLIITFLSFKVGKYSVAQPIMKKVKKLSSIISKKQKLRDQIPSAIKKLTKYLNILIFIFILTILILGICTYLKKIRFRTTYWVLLIAINFITFVYLIVRRKILTDRLKTVGQQQRKIRQNVKQLIQLFGKKVQNNLKANLCRQKILTHQKVPTNVCIKKNCQQLRSNLQIRYHAIRNLAQAALTFQWCSTCKKTHPFDQLLSFQANAMINKQDLNQQEQVQYRTEYLIDGCQKMIQWINKANPCNCSKLYIQEIIKNKRIFNQTDKEVQSKIKRLQRQKSNLS